MSMVVTISGTSRPDNYTARALGVVNEELRSSGIEVVEFDARNLNLPFPGYPDTADAKHLRGTVKASMGVILATPEYHGTFCAMTKLILENLEFPSVLAGKPVALVGVAAGRIGAIKSLEQLKGVCSHVGAIVVPGGVSIAGVRNVFDENGRCVDEASEKALRGVASGLLSFLKDYVCPKYILEQKGLEDGVRGEGLMPWTANV